MKKILTVIAVLLMSVSLMLVLTGCPGNDKNDNNDGGSQSGDGVNHQFGDGVTIPPGGERVREGESGWQSSSGNSSGDGFSVTIEGDDDIIITDTQTVEIDLNDPNAQSGSHRSFSSSGGGD